jgi:predicted transcriptional regulator
MSNPQNPHPKLGRANAHLTFDEIIAAIPGKRASVYSEIARKSGRTPQQVVYDVHEALKVGLAPNWDRAVDVVKEQYGIKEE